VPDAPGAPAWTLHELPAITGHAAALVVAGPGAAIACWDWPP